MWQSCLAKYSSLHHISLSLNISYSHFFPDLFQFTIFIWKQRLTRKWLSVDTLKNKGTHGKVMQALTSLQGAWHNHGQKTHCMVRSSTMASWATRKKRAWIPHHSPWIWRNSLYVCRSLLLTHPHWDWWSIPTKTRRKKRQFNFEAVVMAVHLKPKG